MAHHRSAAWLLVAAVLCVAGTPTAAAGSEPLGDDLVAASGAAPDLTAVRQRLLETYGWPSPLTPAVLGNLSKSAVELASRLLPNGTWPDVDYNDPQDRTIWATAEHMVRVAQMAAALSAPGSPSFADGPLLASTRLALGLWFLKDFQNENWWWNILEQPQVHSIVFLMLDVLPKPTQPAFPTAYELERATAISLRATWWNASLGYEVYGANLAWMMQAQLIRGVWPSLVNVSALDGGFARLWEEAKLVPWEPDVSNGTNQGIQADFSYHFHGPQLQIASYGQDFTNDLTEFLAIADGTQWAVPEGPVGVLCAWAAGGLAWSTTGPGVDWSASGRQESRNTWASESKVQLSTTRMRLLASRCNSTSDASAINVFADGVDGLPTTGRRELGFRSFWTSDYAVHRRSNWTAAWHAHSTRTGANECGNGENLLGVYEAQGVINVVSSVFEPGPNVSVANAPGPLGWGCGLEYATVFPLLDWTALNGVTALTDLGPSPGCGAKAGQQCCWFPTVAPPQATSFVGSASDGFYGAAAYDLAFMGLSAHKSVFFLDACVVAMGSNISYVPWSTEGPSRVRTALASRFLRPDGGGLVLGFANGTTAAGGAAAGNQSFPAGGAGSGALAWAYADGVGWIPSLLSSPSAASSSPAAPYPAAQSWAGFREANWSTIGPFAGSVQGTTMSLTIEHENASSTTSAGGAAPSALSPPSFVYAIVPGLGGPQDMPAYASDPLSSALQLDVAAGVLNTPDVQAVVQVNATDLVIQAVFWNSGGGTFSYAPAPGGPGAGWALSIAVDAPCILVYHEVRGAAAAAAGGRAANGAAASSSTLAASSPDGVGLFLQATLTPGAGSSRAPSGGPVVLPFHLNPADAPDYLGQSAVASCSFGAEQGDEARRESECGRAEETTNERGKPGRQNWGWQQSMDWDWTMMFTTLSHGE